MSIGRICSRETYLADVNESAQVAAERMLNENVGTLVVVDPEMKPIGILTDRDLALRLVARGLNPREAKVTDVMTSHPSCMNEETPIEDVLSRMKMMGVRRVPIVDDDEHLVGIVSTDDVLELVIEELANVGRIIGWGQPGISVPAKQMEYPHAASKAAL